MSDWAGIIVAAGASRRMGSGVSKPFLQLSDGRTVLELVLSAFARSQGLGQSVLVVSEVDRERALRIASLHAWISRVVIGGERRQDSVRAGLDAVGTQAEVVVIHDAARPLVTPALIDAVAACGAEHGAAIAGSRVVDTIKLVDGDKVERTLDRARLVAAQTPQAFRQELLRRAYAAWPADAEPFTDEASLFEAAGFAVRIVEAPRWNLKITTPEDLELVDAVVARRGRVSGEGSRPTAS